MPPGTGRRPASQDAAAVVRRLRRGPVFRAWHDVSSPLPFKGVRLGVTVCEEVWNDPEFWPRRLYPRDPVADLAAQGVDLFVNISSSPFEMGKAAIRRDMIRQHAARHRVPFLYLNQVGGNDELIFDGHSLGFDADGGHDPAGRRLRGGVCRRRRADAGAGASAASAQRRRRRAGQGQRVARGGGVARAAARPARLRAQVRVHLRRARPVRRHRLGAHRRAGRRRAGPVARHRHRHADPLLLGALAARRRGARQQPGHCAITSCPSTTSFRATSTRWRRCCPARRAWPRKTSRHACAARP